MNTNELHEELLRIGRQPVPAPRPEFVEDLLHRIQLSEDLPLPAPVPLVPRQPWIRFRMVAAGAVAAALLAAVGLFSLANEHNNNGSSQELKTRSAQLVSDQSKTFEVRSDGTVVGESAPTIEATCTADARIKVGDGVFECKAKDRVKLEIDVPAAKVTDAQNLTTNQGVQPVAASGPTQLAVPPTTAAPKSSSPASTTPTTAGAPLASATATALPTTTTTTPPAAPSGPLGGAGTAPIIPSTTFDLASTTNDTQVTVSWPTYSGRTFSRYLLLRTLSQSDQLPDTPTWSATSDTSNVVKTFDKADGPSYTVLLDGKALMQDGKTVIPVNTPLVSFRVAVVDSNDNLLALSSTLTLQLKWTVKPSSDPLTPGTTTSTTSTSSTSSTTTSTSSTTTSTTASTSTTK